MAAPSIPNWQALVLKGIGAPVTPQNLMYVNTWARAEGGSASNNPFNTTQLAPGATSYNSVGVRNYASPQQGIQATVQTLLNGRYGNIISALRQGTSAKAAAEALANSPWGTGSLVLKALGSSPVPPAVPPQRLTAPSGGAQKGLSPDLLALFNQGNRLLGLNPLSQSFALAPSRQQTLLGQPARGSSPSLPAPPVSSKRFPGVRLGDPIPGNFQTGVGGEHPTAGLPGFPAHDYFAKPGSPVVAPISGKVVKLSGHDPRLGAVEGAGGPLGWSVYIQGRNGRTYYLTHMGSRDVNVGQTLRAGQLIGTVANYDKFGRPSHIHMGVS